jgi:hypothetical protein
MSVALRPVRTAAWELTIRGTNVTGDIAADVTQIEYIDKLHGESDELRVTLENRDLKWMGSWFPTKGDAITLKLGYQGEPLVKVGTLQLDAPEWAGPPHTVTLKALSAPVSLPIRTASNRPYDETTLRDVAEEIAERQGLTLAAGFIKPIEIKRATQAQESDLAFLKRIAERNGYVMTVRGTDLILVERAQQSSEGPLVRTYAPTDLARYRLEQATTQTYKAAIVTYHDPVTDALIEGHAGDPNATSVDVLRRFQRCESVDDANRVAAAALALANLGETKGTLDVEGDPKLLGGVRVTLARFGKLNGIYQAKEATHTLVRDAGYTTSCEVERVG